MCWADFSGHERCHCWQQGEYESRYVQTLILQWVWTFSPEICLERYLLPLAFFDTVFPQGVIIVHNLWKDSVTV